MIKINNLPEYAHHYNWLVCRVVENELWFWGAFNKHDDAFEVALEVGGVVVPMIESTIEAA